MNSDRFGYICKIDWDWELGEALGGSKIYPSLKDLKAHHSCWKDCGIVKVKVSFEEVIDGEEETRKED